MKETSPINECIKLLYARLLPKDESDKITALFETIFPIAEWGKINWKKMDKFKNITQPKKIISVLEEWYGGPINQSVYIEWDDADLPPVKTTLDKVIHSFSVLDDIGCAKFIFNPDIGYVIEILFTGDITVGIVDPKKKVGLA